ncbi:antitoxin Xre/MbcA/ParS toxin-binding domain-containing protein [Pseudomonas sp. 008]|jgi:putative toxin-antitoxin system antitoxin component (TIGR02293 family)|uniref:antitoxin Xre/MbcA/ParS toxin-binding domain-containing protein n=1 Tax=Pseudomonas sp. 008 TaxID=2803906 RepID=UPI0019524FB2|nr:antitoxin [Pseudomonas sp. 008]
MKTDIWATLYLPSPGCDLHDSIRSKMPYGAFSFLADMLSMDGQMLGKCMGISPNTLSMRARTGHFSSRESERLYALVPVWQESCELFEGDVPAASRFLSSPLRGLNSQAPLEILGMGGDSGAVLELIGRLDNGIPL